jgi:hypothetical protein
MAYPSDITLPTTYKNFGIIDNKLQYNSNYDIAWSFEYSLSSNANGQHGFCTFLTTLSTISAFPGQYLGVIGPSYDSGDIALSIAFDSTGFFALSNTYAAGVKLSATSPNSLIIRDRDNVIFNQPLSSLDTSFQLSVSSYKIMRFIFCNFGRKLYIDYKDTDKYINLLTLPLSTYTWMEDTTIMYPGISFCSPISSVNMTPSTLFIKNFHAQGSINSPSYEYMKYIPLTSTRPTIFTTISGISATPI